MVLSMSLEFLPPNQRIPDINDKSIGFPHTKFEIVSALMLPVRIIPKTNYINYEFLFSRCLIWVYQHFYYFQLLASIGLKTKIY